MPGLELTVVMTSDADSPAGRSGHRDRLHDLLGTIIGVVAPNGAASG